MLSEVHRILKDTGVYICISREVEKKRKKHLKNVAKFNWKVQKTPIQKPIMGAQPARPMRVPDFDDKKNFLFIYTCQKQVDKVIDSDEEQAMGEGM